MVSKPFPPSPWFPELNFINDSLGALPKPWQNFPLPDDRAD
jgi:hypothetical protein